MLKIQALCVISVASRKRLRFGGIGLLGNLEKLPEATGFGVTKSSCELAVPSPRRSLRVRESVSAEVSRECTRGASDVAKTTVGCPDGPGNGAGGYRAPGPGSELRWWCLVAYLPSAPGVLWARSVSTPASNGSPECPGDRIRDAAGSVRADRLRDGHAAADHHDNAKCGRAAHSGRGLHGQPARLPHGEPRGSLHGAAARDPDHLEGRGVHRLPSRARNSLRDQVSTRSAGRSARRRSRRASTTSAGQSARPRSRT